MRHSADAWAIVLAGGDGARLRALTTTRAGVVVPKQYCSFGHSTCLLQDALTRAHSVVAPAHACAVVAAQHRRWWSTALSQVHDTNVFIQPQNKGTGYGILLSLLRLKTINPRAVATLLPADHFFRDEGPITRTLRTAGNLASLNSRAIYLLGADPDGPDSELGYMIEDIGGPHDDLYHGAPEQYIDIAKRSRGQDAKNLTKSLREFADYLEWRRTIEDEKKTKAPPKKKR